MSVDALVEATLRAIDSDVNIKENARQLVERHFNIMSISNEIQGYMRSSCLYKKYKLEIYK